MTEKDPTAKICPVCGATNQCAAASADTQEQCWCYNVTISAQALAAIPEGDLGRRCLCPACAGVNISKTGGTLIER